MALPRSWTLELVRGSEECRIRSARTKERVVAHILLSADASEHECLLAKVDGDEVSMINAVAGEAEAGMYLDGIPAERKLRALEGLAFAREPGAALRRSGRGVLRVPTPFENPLGRSRRAGEGLIGMSWAFQSAGCPTVVVSQWKAASAATARLMIAFHRELLTGTTKAQALRRAALQLKKDARTAHPFYWANFVVVGQP